MNSSSFEHTWIPFTKGCFVLNLVEIGPVVLEKNILKFLQCISTILKLSPLRNIGPFIWTNLNPLHPWIICSSGEENFLNSSMYFPYFVTISPWKRSGPFVWTNLNLLHPRMLFVKFGWFWRRRFLNFVKVFSLSRNYFLLEKGGTLYLNRPECPLPKDTLCQVWLKLAH